MYNKEIYLYSVSNVSWLVWVPLKPLFSVVFTKLAKIHSIATFKKLATKVYGRKSLKKLDFNQNSNKQ